MPGGILLFFLVLPHPWWVGLAFVGFLAGLCGWIYSISIQRRRYREVARVAAKLWSGDVIQPS